MSDLIVWGLEIPTEKLSKCEIDYLSDLPADIPVVEWVWQEMDRVWNTFCLDNSKPISSQNIGAYYSHPVWLMNGIFTHLDSISVGHREAIANFLNSQQVTKIADYGGGFGEMALTLKRVINDSVVTVVEPYPTGYGLERLKNVPDIYVQPDLTKNGFDAVIAQDVLEHVDDPVLLAWQLAESVQSNGVVVFANCFFPYIQCHLPSTFHLRHTFPWVMRIMGLKYQGVIRGAYHAQVFVKTGKADLDAARVAEGWSSKMGPVLNNPISTLISKIKRRVLWR